MNKIHSVLRNKEKAFLICIFTVCLGLPTKLPAQVQHDSGFFLRYLLGGGIGQVSDALSNPATGTAFRTSLALGAFVFRDIALHIGPEYTSNPNIEYEGKADQALRGGHYTHYTLNSGLSYFSTRLNMYFSLEGRLSIGGEYELKGALLETNADGSQTLIDTSRLKGKFSEEEEKFGMGIIVGTEEWLLNNNTALGIALMYSFDLPRRHVFYGLALSLCYN